MDVSADAGGEEEVFIEVSPRYIDADKEGMGSEARDNVWVWCIVANPWIRETISCQSVILPGPGIIGVWDQRDIRLERLSRKRGVMLEEGSGERTTYRHHHKQVFPPLVVLKQCIPIHLAQQRDASRSSGVGTCGCSLLGK